jgi:peptidyl-prolyl cis-trans isomerase-like 4
MKLGYSSKKTGGYLLAFFLLFGILVTVASSTAQAQYPYDRYRNDRYRDDRYRNDRYRDDRYRNDRYRDRNRQNGFQVARQQGYSYGINVGAADAQRGQSYNPQRSRYYRNADQGYSSYYGNRGQYRQVFRYAFIQGYREGFQRYAYNNRRYDRRW